MEKSFREMSFDERVAWARGYLLVAIGEGRFHDAVWVLCNQFTLWPLKKPQIHHYWNGTGKNVAICGAKTGVIHDELNHILYGENNCQKCVALGRKRIARLARKPKR